MKNVTVLHDFFDGSLADAFTKLGYPPLWKRGEKRDIPDELAKRIVDSGGQLTIADDNAKESKVVKGAEPAKNDNIKHYQEKYKKAKLVTVVFPEGFRDGGLTDELAALEHPAEFGVGEIVKLPESLIERIIASGGLAEKNSETINMYKNQQAKHELKIRQWQAEQTKQKELEEHYKGVTEHNQKILAEMEDLSAKFIGQTGKTKEATWQRIQDLQSRLK